MDCAGGSKHYEKLKHTSVVAVHKGAANWQHFHSVVEMLEMVESTRVSTALCGRVCVRRVAEWNDGNFSLNWRHVTRTQSLAICDLSHSDAAELLSTRALAAAGHRQPTLCNGRTMAGCWCDHCFI